MLSSGYFYHMYTFPPTLAWIAPLVLIEVVLKGVALWQAGRNNQLYWFIALLVVNSVGILPAIYLIFFQKRKR